MRIRTKAIGTTANSAAVYDSSHKPRPTKTSADPA
jgi:hypothetical protein